MPDVVLVHRISGLPRASFRFHLAMDTLASGYALGATPCARDFHPLERAHAGRTKNSQLGSPLVGSKICDLSDWIGFHRITSLPSLQLSENNI